MQLTLTGKTVHTAYDHEHIGQASHTCIAMAQSPMQASICAHRRLSSDGRCMSHTHGLNMCVCVSVRVCVCRLLAESKVDASTLEEITNAILTVARSHLTQQHTPSASQDPNAPQRMRTKAVKERCSAHVEYGQIFAVAAIMATAPATAPATMAGAETPAPATAASGASAGWRSFTTVGGTTPGATPGVTPGSNPPSRFSNPNPTLNNPNHLSQPSPASYDDFLDSLDDEMLLSGIQREPVAASAGHAAAGMAPAPSPAGAAGGYAGTAGPSMGPHSTAFAAQGAIGAVGGFEGRPRGPGAMVPESGVGGPGGPDAAWNAKRARASGSVAQGPFSGGVGAVSVSVAQVIEPASQGPAASVCEDGWEGAGGGGSMGAGSGHPPVVLSTKRTSGMSLLSMNKRKR